jgi:predicted MFS family arabinose efflux permease
LVASLLLPSFIAQVISQCGFQCTRWGLITLLPVVVIHAMQGMPNSTFTRYQRAGNFGFLSALIGLGSLSSLTGIYPILCCAVVATIGSVLPFFAKLPVGEAPKNDAAKVGNTVASYQSLGRNRLVLILSGILFFTSMINPMLFTFLPLRMKEMGASSGAVSNVIALCGVFALVGLPHLGRLLDRISYQAVFLVVPALAALRVALLGLPSDNYWMFGLQQLMHIPTSVVLELALVQAVSRNFQAASLPRVQGIINASALSGMALGSFMAAQSLPLLNNDLQILFFLFASMPLFAYPFVLAEHIKVEKRAPHEHVLGASMESSVL